MPKGESAVYTLWYKTKGEGTCYAGTQFIVFKGNSVPALSSFPGSDNPLPQSYVLSYFFKHALGLTAGQF